MVKQLMRPKYALQVQVVCAPLNEDERRTSAPLRSHDPRGSPATLHLQDPYAYRKVFLIKCDQCD